MLVPTEPSLQEVEEHFMYLSIKPYCLYSKKIFLTQDTFNFDFECYEICKCRLLPCMISEYITCCNAYLI